MGTDGALVVFVVMDDVMPMSKPNAAATLTYAPIVTEASPRSMRCKVTRDRPAAPAVATALMRKALRCMRNCAPSARRATLAASATGGAVAGIVILIIVYLHKLHIMRIIFWHFDALTGGDVPIAQKPELWAAFS
jgi:hypothetical protein